MIKYEDIKWPSTFHHDTMRSLLNACKNAVKEADKTMTKEKRCPKCEGVMTHFKHSDFGCDAEELQKFIRAFCGDGMIKHNLAKAILIKLWIFESSDKSGQVGNSKL